jgi:hypothetical protein
MKHEYIHYKQIAESFNVKTCATVCSYSGSIVIACRWCVNARRRRRRRRRRSFAMCVTHVAGGGAHGPLDYFA